MLAFGHASTAWCGSLVVTDALSLPVLPWLVIATTLALIIAAIEAGAALVPDFDHPSSTVSTALGPLTHLVHLGTVELHYMVASCANREHDRRPPGAHRGVTHWWPFPLFVGAALTLGCLASQWTEYGALAFLFCVALRGLTVPGTPDPKPGTPLHTRVSLRTAHRIAEHTPVIALLRRGRRHVTRTHKVGGYWTHIAIPIGKCLTASLGAGLAWLAMSHGALVLRPWLGALVCIGMWAHDIGDSPTHMGIPGYYLTHIWKLPRWLAFYAGGAFEVLCIWIPASVLGVLLIPGLLPRAWTLQLAYWTAEAVGVVMVLALIVHAIAATNQRRKAKQWGAA